MRLSTLFLVAYSILATTHADPLNISISPNANPSSCAIKSVEQARDKIRELKENKQYPEEGIVVEFEEGVYYFSSALTLEEEDSGLDGKPIIYRAAPNAKVIITGGQKLSNSQAISDSKTLALLPSQSEDHVQAYSLETNSQEPIPGFSSGGAGFRGTQEYPYELYQGDSRLTLARWPNQGHAKTGDVSGEKRPYRDRKDMLTSYSGVFEFPDTERLNTWSQEPDLWLDGKWYHHWADQRMPVDSIDTEASTIALQNPESHAYGYKENRDFYAFNAISELDQPGEWAIDRTNRMLYVWPDNSSASSNEISLAMNQNLLIANNTRHIHFENLTFQDTTGDAIILNQCEDVTIIGCTITKTGGWGVKINHGFRCEVISCDLNHLGEGGIQAIGGLRHNLTPGEHLIENCHISDFAQKVSTYRPAVELKGVGNGARHNLIHDTPHSALMFDGNNHLIEYNIIHDVALHASDTGAIYTCTRDWSKRGTVIRNNLVHALGKPLDGAGCRAIYLDDHTSGVIIDKNIVTMSSVGIHIGGGKDNIVNNNLTLNCDTSIDYASRGTDSFASAQAKQGEDSPIYQTSINSPWDTPIWLEAYPKIGGIFEMDPVEAHFASGNQITHNIMAGGSDIRIQNANYVLQTSVVEKNALVDGDPGLANPLTLDFNLQSSDKIVAAEPFEEINFDHMGLYEDQWRPTPVTKFGPEVTSLPEIRRMEDFEQGRPSAKIDLKPANFIRIDALRDQYEWTGRFDHRTACEISVAGERSKEIAYSQLAYDQEAIYVYAHIEHDPDIPLVLEGEWGKRDGFEIAIQDPRVPSAATILIQCYPDETFQVSPIGAMTEGQAQRIEESITYAANQQNGLWTAELRIPLGAIDVSTAELARFNYNMNVRRMADASWMMWARPNGNFWEISRAGLLKMPSFDEG
ncbi:right-handed parallel beta-helix repeat-containing protein [Rubellicoccus peritrichatus]|uniref:Right-handed parallel beta-helix repeat-containing protein n=1 Tax=Rubellicoccus peritrichatus TaxID=3080537 RepID=A0AAQ3L5Y0_9BACT|nr:right-handed parallel beta-helix repeat-containing protein [Puniceicoccus sp. CR14]WOO40064.1 right-handed parallel beta-helix repeat-containing protein [Puniceicoccus sp. CR14]